MTARLTGRLALEDNSVKERLNRYLRLKKSWSSIIISEKRAKMLFEHIV